MEQASRWEEAAEQLIEESALANFASTLQRIIGRHHCKSSRRISADLQALAATHSLVCDCIRRTAPVREAT
eukprot:9225211-Karenia_brevis.AAC.1